MSSYKTEPLLLFVWFGKLSRNKVIKLFVVCRFFFSIFSWETYFSCFYPCPMQDALLHVTQRQYLNFGDELHPFCSGLLHSLTFFPILILSSMLLFQVASLMHIITCIIDYFWSLRAAVYFRVCYFCPTFCANLSLFFPFRLKDFLFSS